MHDNTALGYLQRSLQYLFRPGNLLYCGALAAVFIALRLLGDEGLAGVGMFIWFAAFALIAVFTCKMLDSIQRLILGLEAEPVPLDVLSKLPKSVAIEAVIAVIFYGVIIYFIQLPLEGESRAFAFKTASVLLYALTPAIVLGLLQGARFSPPPRGSVPFTTSASAAILSRCSFPSCLRCSSSSSTSCLPASFSRRKR